MSSEWPLTPLRSFVDLVAGFAFKSTGYTDSPEDIRLLRGDNIAPGSVRWDGVKRWARADAVDLARYSLSPGDVVLAMDRPWIPTGLKVAQVQAADTPSYLVQRVARLRPESSGDCSFLFALLSTREFESHIQNVTTGTAVPHISARQILDFEFRLPPTEVRARIGEFVAALNSRITLLRETNATLEAIAQALFKSWFVDFDPVRAKRDGRAPEGMGEATAALFPDSFEDSELGAVPAGWSAVALTEHAEVVMGLSPKGDSYNIEGQGVPLINGPVEFGDYFPVQSKWTTAADRMAQAHDLIFCVRGSTTGKRVISDGRYCIGRGVCAIRSRAARHQFLYKTIDQGLPRLLSKTTGSVFPSLSAPDIKNFKVLNPGHALTAAFEESVRPLDQRIALNVRQAQVLADLRNTLLPRLISGQLRLPEAQAIVAEAA